MVALQKAQSLTDLSSQRDPSENQRTSGLIGIVNPNDLNNVFGTKVAVGQMRLPAHVLERTAGHSLANVGRAVASEIGDVSNVKISPCHGGVAIELEFAQLPNIKVMP